MKISDILDFKELGLIAGLDDMVRNNLLSQKYITGQAEFTSLGLSFELLPNQFYKNHGYVGSIPNPPEGEPLGLCTYGFDHGNGLLKVDLYILQNLDPIEDAFARGHEESHACSYFGKLTEIYDVLRSRKGGFVNRYVNPFIDEEFARSWDRTMLGLVDNSFESLEKFIDERKNRMQKICNACGLYSLWREGYDFQDTMDYLNRMRN